MRFRALGLLLALLTFVSSARGEAEHRRLAFLGVDAVLDRSAAIALTPWDVEVVPLDVAPPPREIGEASRGARAIASSAGVDAVVWLVDGTGTRTLILYDARADQIVSHEVAAGPIDDAVAAAITLSLKTLLRASTVAPQVERLGAPEQMAPPGIGLLRLEGDLSLRVRTTGAVRADPRVGLALAWWPRAWHRWLGIALRIEEGTGIGVQNDEFTGRLTDHAASLSLRSHIALSSRFAFEPSLGAGLHLTLLDGATVDGQPSADLTRVDPTLETSVLFSATLGHGVELGLRAGASFWGRSQEYDVDNTEPVLTLPAVQGNLGLMLGAALN